jgi:hypothetical protein
MAEPPQSWLGMFAITLLYSHARAWQRADVALIADYR